MSLIYDLRMKGPGIGRAFRDYVGEIGHFARRVQNPILMVPLVTLKSIEWSI
jgi:hypothetical protein